MTVDRITEWIQGQFPEKSCLNLSPNLKSVNKLYLHA